VQTLGVAPVRCFGFALLAMKGALPAKGIGKRGKILLLLERLDGAVVKGECLRCITSPLGVACLLD
jgi:hypothetical protein